MDRWSPKPRVSAQCDAFVGVDDVDNMPMGRRCKNAATETVLDELGIQNWVCESCAESLESRGKARRNPQRKVN